jgi:trigger factor
MTPDVEATVHRKPACRVKIDVKASPSLVSAARKEAIKKVNKDVNFPGFRRGKAPEDLILKKHPFAVEQAWHKAIADASYIEAQRIVRVPVLNTNSPISFDLKSHSLELGAELSFSFETEPTIPTVDPKEFILKEEAPVVVEEKQLEEAIHQARYYFAEWIPVTDRGIQEGDAIMIDLDLIDGEPQKVFNHVRFEVSKSRMAQWMQNLVLGAKTGDQLEGVSEADADASEEEKKEFVPKKVRVTIHKVEIANLPEVNDDFAKKIGAPDVEAMRNSIKLNLQHRLEEDAKMKRREIVNDFLIQRYDFELPLSLIETERDHRKKEHLSAYEALSEEEKKNFDEKLFIESSKSVRIFYLARQIVRDAKLPISQNEVQNEAIQFAREKHLHVDPANLPKELFALALSKIILFKAQDYVLSNCTIDKVLDPQESQTL